MTSSAKAFAGSALLLLTVALSGAHAAQQAGAAPTPSSVTATAQIIGSVVDGRSGQPLTGSVVTIAGRGVAARHVVVDPSGRFVFRDLPAGNFSLQATKAGYVGGGFKQQQALGLPAPFEITADARLADLTLRLWKLGVVDGSVTGDGNEPLVGVEVHALRHSLIGGGWHLIDAGNVTTDDRGHFRIGNLPPGDYALIARPPRTREVSLLLSTLAANPAAAADVMTAATMSGHGDPELDPRMRDYPLTVFPLGAAADRATLVAISAGGEQTGADFHLKSARIVRVTGMVAGDSVPSGGVSVRLVPAGSASESTPLEAAIAATDDEGHFAFSGVTPGVYDAIVVLNPFQGNGVAPPPAIPAGTLPADPTLWGRTPVTVALTDFSGLTIQLHKGSTVSGRLSFDGADPPAAQDLAQIGLRLDSLDQPPPAANAPVWRGRVEPDGQFRTMGVPPGRYLLRLANLPRGWNARSALVEGHDVLDWPMEIGEHDVAGVTIALTTRPLAAITGTVRDGAGQPAPESTLLIFAVDRTAWADTGPLSRRLRASRPIRSGTYYFPALPAGEYCVLAVAGDPPPNWQDSALLEGLMRRATRVHVDVSGVQTVDLEVSK